MINILFVSFAVAVLLETTIISFPIFFILSFLAYILYPEPKTIIGVFLLGFVLDSLKASPLGFSSALILGSFLLVEIIKSLFELKDQKLTLALLFVLSYAFSYFSKYNPNILIHLAIFILAAGAFNILRKRLWQG